MITVEFYENENGSIYGFELKDHSESNVCAAVSALTINTVNSIEKFTEGRFICEYNESGGHLFFEHPLLKSGGASRDATLLLNAMVLGLYGVMDGYKSEIKIEEAFHD